MNCDKFNYPNWISVHQHVTETIGRPWFGTNGMCNVNLYLAISPFYTKQIIAFT